MSETAGVTKAGDSCPNYKSIADTENARRLAKRRRLVAVHPKGVERQRAVAYAKQQATAAFDMGGDPEWARAHWDWSVRLLALKRDYSDGRNVKWGLQDEHAHVSRTAWKYGGNAEYALRLLRMGRLDVLRADKDSAMRHVALVEDAIAGLDLSWASKDENAEIRRLADAVVRQRAREASSGN